MTSHWFTIIEAAPKNSKIIDLNCVVSNYNKFKTVPAHSNTGIPDSSPALLIPHRYDLFLS